MGSRKKAEFLRCVLGNRKEPTRFRGGSRKKSDCCAPQYKWAWSLPVGVVKIAKFCQTCRKNRGTIKSYLFTYM